MLVDTLGLVWGLAVLPADLQDWTGAAEVARRAGDAVPRLARVRADAGYRAFAGWVAGHCRRVLTIVAKRPGQVGFEVQPRRWVVERTFGWFGRYRRLSTDYEANPRSSEAWISVAMIHRMARFSLPNKNRNDDLLKRPRKKPKTNS